MTERFSTPLVPWQNGTDVAQPAADMASMKGKGRRPRPDANGATWRATVVTLATRRDRRAETGGPPFLVVPASAVSPYARYDDVPIENSGLEPTSCSKSGQLPRTPFGDHLSEMPTTHPTG